MKKRFVGSVIFCAAILLSACARVDKAADACVSLDGTYRVENMDNIRFSFTEQRFLTVQQTGIYELTENEKQQPIVRICLDDITRELPEEYVFTEYLLEKDRMYTKLSLQSDYMDEVKESDESVSLICIQGKDGLLEGKPFAGVYQIGADGDDYQYLFQKDGTVILQIEQRYSADETGVTLTDAYGEIEYLYEKNENGLTLKNTNGESIFNLLLQE